MVKIFQVLLVFITHILVSTLANSCSEITVGNTLNIKNFVQKTFIHLEQCKLS